MGLLVAILVFALLLVGFLYLTAQEKKHSVRLFTPLRASLDRQVGRVASVMRDIDIGVFLWHALRAGIEFVVHEVVHVVLLGVRTLERLLTRTARELRGRRAADESAPRTPFFSGVERIRRALGSL